MPYSDIQEQWGPLYGCVGQKLPLQIQHRLVGLDGDTNKSSKVNLILERIDVVLSKACQVWWTFLHNLKGKRFKIFRFCMIYKDLSKFTCATTSRERRDELFRTFETKTTTSQFK
jgi:hypothetical protein